MQKSRFAARTIRKLYSNGQFQCRTKWCHYKKFLSDLHLQKVSSNIISVLKIPVTQLVLTWQLEMDQNPFKSQW